MEQATSVDRLTSITAVFVCVRGGYFRYKLNSNRIILLINSSQLPCDCIQNTALNCLLILL